jgi:hypothetical protein
MHYKIATGCHSSTSKINCRRDSYQMTMELNMINVIADGSQFMENAKQVLPTSGKFLSQPGTSQNCDLLTSVYRICLKY